MTAPRTARPYRPEWWEPRAGIVALLRCAAMAVAIVVLGVAACSTRAGGQEGPRVPPPVSVPVYAGGKLVCRGVSVPNGYATAAHCARFGPLRLADGVARPYSVDAGGRDLAHVLTAGVTATLGSARVGDVLAWANDRITGTARVARTTTGFTRPGVWNVDRPGQAVLILCVESGGPFRRGDSGTGMADAAGHVAALFVGGDLDDQFGSWDCGRAQRVFAVQVP